MQSVNLTSASMEIVEFSGKGKRSAVWNHFGFPSYSDKGVDKTKTVCKPCKALCSYSGNTSTLQTHLDKHHWQEVHGTVKLVPQLAAGKHKQATVTSMFAKQEPLAKTSQRSEALTKALAEMVVLDRKPLTIVEDRGFQNFVKVAEPRYALPSRHFLMNKYIRPMYHDTVASVKEELTKAVRHSVTLTAGSQLLHKASAPTPATTLILTSGYCTQMFGALSMHLGVTLLRGWLKT